MRELLALALAWGVIGTAYVAATPPPDPPPGTSKPVTIVKRDYVCAFTMDRVDSDATHDYWQVGKKRWCKWVNR